MKDRQEAGEDSNDEDTGVEVYSKEAIMSRIKLVKKSGYNFDKYLLLVKNQNDESFRTKGSDFDINDLLSGLFSKDDD